MEQLVDMLLGFREGSHVKLSIRWPPNGGWLSAIVDVRDGAFSEAFETILGKEELSSFADQLRSLYRTLRGTVRFDALEGAIDLAIEGNGRGNLRVHGYASDDPAKRRSRSLHSDFEIDQTFLPPAIAALEGLPRE